MSAGYVVRRVLLFFVVVWAATTFIFFLPKLAPGRNPIVERIGMMVATGGVNSAGMKAMVDAYEAKFGLDKPLWQQYLTYLGDLSHGDLGYSLMLYPTKVLDIILVSIPWTIGLLTVSTFLAFTLGTLLGGLLAWPRAPRSLQFFLPPLFMFSVVPYYLFGLILVYLLAFQLRIFPMSGSSNYGTTTSFSIAFAADVVYHSILPALSIVLASVGFWALGMRAMMVSIAGEDYMLFADAKGLKSTRIFLRYAMRNALLPQTTTLALSLGTILSGALLVEIVFNYAGMGAVLFRAVSGFDYFTIYGVVFFIIVGVALATLALDLVYPLLDPRIRYNRS
ncbi:MAG TPA: ABC transporter permease [Chloroflexota bacterium]|nr:ABC transporter permease [Chloroflexota bacterium]